MAAVHLGTESERVRIEVLRRLDLEATTVFEQGWLAVIVDVRTGGFSGKTEAVVHVEELRRFRRELDALHERLDGRARLDSVEGWFTLALTADAKGHVELTGMVRDRPPPHEANELHFRLHLDQSYLPDAVEALDGAVDVTVTE